MTKICSLVVSILLSVAVSKADVHSTDYDTCCISDLERHCDTRDKMDDTSEFRKQNCGTSKIKFVPSGLTHGSYYCTQYPNNLNTKVCLRDTILTGSPSFSMGDDSKLSGYRSSIKLGHSVALGRKALAYFAGFSEAPGVSIDYQGNLDIQPDGRLILSPTVGFTGSPGHLIRLGEGSMFNLSSQSQYVQVSIGDVEIGMESKISIIFEGGSDLKPEIKALSADHSIDCEISVKTLREDDSGNHQRELIYYESSHPVSEKCTLAKMNPETCFCKREEETCCNLKLERLIVTGGQKKRKLDTCYTKPLGSYADGSKSTPSIDAATSAKKCFFISHININSIIMKSSSRLDVRGSKFDVPIIKLNEKSQLIVETPFKRLEPDYEFVATSVVVGNKGNFTVVHAVNTNFDKVEVGARGSLVITGDRSVNVTETPSFNATGKIDIEPGSGLQANLVDGDSVQLKSFKARRAGHLELGPNVQFTATDKIVLLENAKLTVKGKVNISSVELKVNGKLRIISQVSKRYPLFFNLKSQGKIILEESALMEVEGAVWADIRSAIIGVKSSLQVKTVTVFDAVRPNLPGRVDIKYGVVLEDETKLKIKIGPSQTVRFSHITVLAGFKCTLDAAGSSFVKGAVTITARNITEGVEQECIITEYTRTTTTNDPYSRKPTPVNGEGTNDLDMNRNFTVAISLICAAVVVGLIVYLIIRHRRQQQQQQQALVMQFSGMPMAGQPALPFAQQSVKQPAETPVKSAAETPVKTKNDALVKPSFGKKADEVKPTISKSAEAVQQAMLKQQASPSADVTQHADSE